MTDDRRVDLIFRAARLIDGSGGPSRRGDLAVSGDRIVALGDLGDWRGAVELDAGGKALAPGFIDVHTHDDRAALATPTMDCKASQGVTSVVVGNCGISLAPLTTPTRPPAPIDLICERPEGFFGRFGDYLEALDQDPPALNVLAQVGHGSLRVQAMDDLDRPATATEIKAMRGALEDSLEAGAIGMSTGLFYPPAVAASTEEVIELGKPLAAARAIHTTHMRDEGDAVMASLEESFHIGRALSVPVVVSHHKCTGQRNFGLTRETLPFFDRTIAEQPVSLDVYPYVAGSTMLAPGRGYEALRVIVSWSVPHPEAAGRDLGEVAAEMGLSKEDAIEALSPAGGIFFMMDEGDVQRILAHPHSMIGSDGLPHDEHPHPRLWGTFPRVLGHYARELGLFSMEEAVRKMTRLSADRFGMTDRGRLDVGAVADLVLFDPETVIDNATFDNPKSPATGIDQVFVAGRAVWRDGAATGVRPGRAIRLRELAIAG